MHMRMGHLDTVDGTPGWLLGGSSNGNTDTKSADIDRETSAISYPAIFKLE